jgi:hypothetical protein
MKAIFVALMCFWPVLTLFSQQSDSLKNQEIEQVSFCNDQVKEEEIKGLIKPSFPGGEDSVLAFVKRAVPDSVQTMCGEVYLYLTVDTLGNIDILRMSVARDSVCGKQIVSAFYGMPRWNPALYVNEAGELKKQSWNTQVRVTF